MTSLRHTNSWHWLLMSMTGSLLLTWYPCHLVWHRTSEVMRPKLLQMESHASQLKGLREEDLDRIELQTVRIQEQADAYETLVSEQMGDPIPEGERSVQKLSNGIGRALQEHQLRVVEQEQVSGHAPSGSPEGRKAKPRAALEVRRAAAARAVAAKEAAGKQDMPFQTREIRYVVEGEYKQMFMFLVRQSHGKPSYHLKDIRISPSTQATGMRMEFTAEIHFI